MQDSGISLYLNTQSPKLDDVRVRQAIGWGIDRQEVIDLGYDGIGRPAPSWYASNAAYPEAKRVGFTEYAPEKAGQLLEEAGWMMGGGGVRKKGGKVLKLTFVTYGVHKAALETVRNQLKKVGVLVETKYAKDYGFIAALRRDGGALDATLEWWDSIGLPELWRHFASEGDLNYSHYRDPVMDQLIESIKKRFDKDERHKLILEANERIFETAQLIPVLGQNALLAVNKNVKGYVPHYLYQYLVTPDWDIE